MYTDQHAKAILNVVTLKQKKRESFGEKRGPRFYFIFFFRNKVQLYGEGQVSILV